MMYDDDEEDLALLQQYEREGANISDEDLDSDLEDKLMSAVQYETDATHNWSSTSQHRQQQQHGKQQQASDSTDRQLATRSTIPPIDMTQPATDTAQHDFSSDGYSSSGDDSNIENDDPLDNNLPPIIRHIDLNITDKQLQQDDATDDEEQVLNYELQELIDQQIRKRKHRQQSFRKPRQVPFCFSCLSPGHIQRECSLCSDCGGERHPSGRCPGVFYCHRCKERGHYALDCKNKKCYDSCYHCGEDAHASQCCPRLVHVYKDQVPPSQTSSRYCYNCGKKGHYGDECPTLPDSSQSQQSVFSFNSLSILKDPRLQDGDSRRHSRRGSYESHPSKRHRHHSSSQSHHHTPSHQRFSDHSDSDSDRPAKKNNRRTRKKEKNKNRHHDRHTKKQNGQQETERASGNNNWKLLTKKTTASSSTSSSSSRPGHGHTNDTTKIQNDFPRNLPKPSFSGVINTEPAPRRPKYNGGYNRC